MSLHQGESTPKKVANDHPFLLALLVLLVVVIPGFVQSQRAVNKAQDTSEQAQSAVDRNEVVVRCLTKYATDLTDALQDRDTISVTAREAQQELWRKIRHYLADGSDQTPVLHAVRRYEKILRQLARVTSINPYPDLGECFGPEEKLSFEAAGIRLSSATIKTSASSWTPTCFGRRITIWGTKGNDVITGTDHSDVVFAWSGDDVIRTGKGNDFVCARWGDDIVNAGQGNDRVACGPGDDFAIQAEYTLSC